jgi:ribosomal protein S18 acetylase RimI-like enzyme
VALTIRLAGPSDYASAGAATARAYEALIDADSPSQSSYLAVVADMAARASNQTLFVADYDGKLIGSVSLATRSEQAVTPGAAHIRMLGVSPEYQGLGAGKALLQACIDYCRRDHIPVLGLRTTAVMASAQRLYEKLGFRRDPLQDYESEGWGKFLAYRLDL